jgi:radical SAM superfamily enzyme YgiQ (UPF0313 family)
MATRDVIGAGPRSLAGVLEERDIESRITVVEDVLKGIVELEKYDLLLVSGMTSDLTAVRRSILRWRRTSAGLAVVGGPIASDPRHALVRARGDIAVFGEGEQTLLELLDIGLDRGKMPHIEDLAKVLGVAYLDHGAIQVTGFRPSMRREDYDRMKPSTEAVRGYPLHYAARVYVEVLRGCSNYIRAKCVLPVGACADCGQCTGGDLRERYDCPLGIPPGCGYCSVPSLYGPPKSRSSERILEEIRGLLAEGVRRVVLSAPDFLDFGRDLLVEPAPLTDPRRPEPNYIVIEELLSLLLDMDEFSDGSASLITENVKGSLVTEQAATLLGKYISETPVNVGFETGSEAHTAKIGRPSTTGENLNAVRRLKEAGLKPYVYFIHGLPGQSSETVEETVKAIDKTVKAGASRIILYRFQPLPLSAFKDRSRAPPAAKDDLSNRIYIAAQKANRTLKEEMVGRVIRVVVTEAYDKDRSLQVAYPMLHGPVVLLEDAEEMEGMVVETVVTGVVSERIVRGRLRGAMF